MQIATIQIDKNYQEKTLHGSYDFPIAVYLTQLDKKVLGFVNWHWHKEIQFSLVTKGEVEFFVNQNSYILTEGQGIFINSGSLHMSKPLKSPDSTYICIDADVKMLTFFQGSIIEQKYVEPFLKLPILSAVTLDYQVAYQKIILEKIKSIYNLYTQKAFGYELDIGMELMAIWRQLIARQPETTPEAKTNGYIDEQRIKTILSYIHAHYMEKITLQEIAALVNISEGECCRCFKRVTKCTIFEYMMSYRINKSIGLLTATDMTISQISDSVGFGSTSYYIESFKKQVLCTPNKYRNFVNCSAEAKK